MSGLLSRATTLRRYSYPPDTAHQALPQPLQLYIDKGHDPQLCLYSNSSMRKITLCAVVRCSLSGTCACHGICATYLAIASPLRAKLHCFAHSSIFNLISVHHPPVLAFTCILTSSTGCHPIRPAVCVNLCTKGAFH